MSRWLPDPGEERWLEVTARLRAVLAPDALLERAGGWRGTGTFARIALFGLGCVAAGLVLGLLGLDGDTALLAAALVTAAAAEWLKQGRRLHASGIEEGLCYGSYVMLALWVADLGSAGRDTYWIALILATAAAGFRLLNAFLTACAAVYAIGWCAGEPFARAIDEALGAGVTGMLLAGALALFALAAGSREFRRPSLDNMLDWLVVAMSLVLFAWRSTWVLTVSMTNVPAGVTPRAVLACGLLLALAAVSLVVGLRRRRHAPLLAGLLCAAGLAVELRFAIGGPTEAWLVCIGVALIAASSLLDRRLRTPRRGITSARLTDRAGPLDLLQSAGAAVAMRSVQPEPPPATSAHDGRFGGGGASGEF
jgi:hypothetical protein